MNDYFILGLKVLYSPLPTSCKNKCQRLQILYPDHVRNTGSTRTKIPGSLICRYCEITYTDISIIPLTAKKKNRCPCCSQKMALIHQTPEILVSRI